MNLKAQYVLGHKWPYFIIAMFILAIMFFQLRGIVSQEQVLRIGCFDNSKIELAAAKALYDPNCFVYNDEEVGRSVPGTLDLNRFTQENFDACFSSDKDGLSFVLEDCTIGSDKSKDIILKKPVWVIDGAVKKWSILTVGWRKTC